MTTHWPCTRCGLPGIKNLGTVGYCAEHLRQLYERFSPDVFALAGVGLQNGPLRPEWGPGVADLECNSCGAGWTGLVGEACWWCERSRSVLIQHQADRLVEAPNVDPSAERYEPEMLAWRARLLGAVEVGVLEKARAASAWRRAVTRERTS